jgi:hypothetical protein
MQRPDPKKTNKEWSWSTYFAIKKQKLQLQLDENKEALTSDVDESLRSLFKNIGIFVNGFTNPTSIELRSLMLKHGGSYHEYMNEKVTHIIASNLAHSKALILKNKKVTKPEWILDSLKEKRLLNSDRYILQTSAHDKAQNKLTGFDSKLNTIEKDKLYEENRALDHSSVDLTNSPPPPPPPSGSAVSIAQQQQHIKNKSQYEKSYKFFRGRLKNFKSNETLNKSDTELENLKHLLDDWICWTSKSTTKQQAISDGDLFVFKGYLFYLLTVEKNLEKLNVILKILKRLIEKSGSFEWIEFYKEIVATMQADFYEEYNSTLNIY